MDNKPEEVNNKPEKADNKPGKSPVPPPKKEKYSIVTYLVLLFAVVIALVLLSYAVQSSRDSDIDSLRWEHMTRMDALELELETMEGRVAELEGQVAEMMEIIGSTGE